MRAAIVLAGVVVLAVLAAAVLGVGVVLSLPSGGSPAATKPAPTTPAPSPRPEPPPKPKPRKPWGSSGGPVGLAGEESVVNGRSYESETLSADFPASEWIRNIGSKQDGAGMCVMTSIEMVSLYLGMEDFRGLRDWCAKEPGGGYPGKVEDQLKRYAAEKKIELPRYVNFEGPDPEPLLEALDAQGLPCAHTYGWSPRYSQRIAHMVASVKYGGRTAVVLDNNEIGGLDPAGGKLFEWMTTKEWVRRAKYGQDSCWVFAWLSIPPPPPCPKVE